MECRGKMTASAFDYAIQILNRRDNSVLEIRQKLQKKKYLPDDIENGISKLQNLGYLNNTRFADGRVHYRATCSGWGKKRIYLELKEKGVSSRDIDNAMRNLKNENWSWYNSAKKNIENRFKSILNQDTMSEKENTKVINFLLRRGFSYDESVQAINGIRSKNNG